MNSLYVCFLLVRLASSIPLALPPGSKIPPLPFPAHEDVSSCHFTPTTQSPTQPWHGATLYPTDNDNDNTEYNLVNQTLPLPFSPPSLVTAPVAVTSKRDDDNDHHHPLPASGICTTIAEFTFANLPILSYSGIYKTRPLTLGPGIYVLSFTNDRRIRFYAVQKNVDHRTTISTHQVNANSGTGQVSLGQTTEVVFFFSWVVPAHSPGLRSSGEVALFRIGPGVQLGEVVK